MRIVITGATGFLGKWFSYMATKSWPDAKLDKIGSDVDLTNQTITEEFLESTRPTHIWHLAARVGGIEANRQHPGSFFRDNMRMGLNILDAARKLASPPKIIMVGTCCSYPLAVKMPMREMDIWEGFPEETNAPYGIAKRSLLTMAEGYKAEYGMSIKTAILANLYGPGDNFDLVSSHVIPGMIRRILEAKEAKKSTVTLWGDGSPSREFLYVEDAARALVGMPYMDFDVVNIGSGITITMKNLAATISRLVQFDGEIIWDSTKPNGQPHRVLDTSRSDFALSTQRMPIILGLQQTIEWYLKHRDQS